MCASFFIVQKRLRIWWHAMHFMQFMYVHEWFIVFYDEVQSSISQKEENMLENIRITVSQPRLFFWTRIKCVHDLEWHSKEFILFKTTLVSVEWFFPKIHSNDHLPHKVNYSLSLSRSLMLIIYLKSEFLNSSIRIVNFNLFPFKTDSNAIYFNWMLALSSV